MADVEAGDQAEEIDLNAFDPGGLDADDTPQRSLEAGAAVGRPCIGKWAKVLADGVRRQRDREFRYGAQHRRHECVAVGSRPDPVIAELVVAIIRDRRLDLGDERGGLRSAQVDENARRIAEPTRVRRPAIAAHRLTPADYVVAGPGCGILRLEHDPAMNRKNALPAPGMAGEDEQPCVPVSGRRWQHANARPVGLAKTCRLRA